MYSVCASRCEAVMEFPPLNQSVIMYFYANILKDFGLCNQEP